MKKNTLILVCFCASLVASQLQAQTDVAGANPGDSEVTEASMKMQTPPPISGESYPTAASGQERSNYLNGGLIFTTAYSDNTLTSANGNAVSDVSYSIWPTIAIDETTSRLHSVISYNPGFTFYQRTSNRNESDQNLNLNFQYRLSPHVTVSFQDGFRKSSSVFNQPGLASSVPVSGSGQAPIVTVVAPVADMLSNTGNTGITYQFAANEMIGASGTFTNLHYLDPFQVGGLGDSSSLGGSAFYSYRVSRRHYVGGTYRFQRFLMFPSGSAQNETQTHTISIFYTFYVKPTLSFSVSGGPQYSDIEQPTFPTTRSWTPAFTASFGWQRRHTNFAGNYTRIVSGGGGLLGTYHSNTVSTTFQWQVARTWSISGSGNYAIYKNATPFSFATSQGGHSISGTASLHHTLTQHLSAEAGYTRLHQSFDNISFVTVSPDTNREYISLSYQFTRPLGR